MTSNQLEPKPTKPAARPCDAGCGRMSEAYLAGQLLCYPCHDAVQGALTIGGPAGGRWCLRCTAGHPYEHQLEGELHQVLADVEHHRTAAGTVEPLPECCRFLSAAVCGCSSSSSSAAIPTGPAADVDGGAI